ncbi:MAG: RNA polymerase sigma-70 factor [Cyclobacteriaceae bacterium]|nr:RNA polymerase sigma-70 factor [Cyclobacteriaceae bacterium]
MMLAKHPDDFEQLIGRIIQNDDRQAFKDLFYFLIPKLTSYITYIIGDKSIAEEIAADVLTKFWINRKNINSGVKVKNYFFVVAKNKAFNFLRDESKRKFVGLENTNSATFVLSENAENNLIAAELQEVISDAINGLPQRCKMVFQLVRIEEMSYKETAELMDVSLKTVENQMTKALNRIRHAIEHYRTDQKSNFRYLNSVLLLLSVFFL